MFCVFLQSHRIVIKIRSKSSPHPLMCLLYQQRPYQVWCFLLWHKATRCINVCVSTFPHVFWAYLCMHEWKLSYTEQVDLLLVNHSLLPIQQHPCQGCSYSWEGWGCFLDLWCWGNFWHGFPYWVIYANLRVHGYHGSCQLIEGATWIRSDMLG